MRLTRKVTLIYKFIYLFISSEQRNFLSIISFIGYIFVAKSNLLLLMKSIGPIINKLSIYKISVFTTHAKNRITSKKSFT